MDYDKINNIDEIKELKEFSQKEQLEYYNCLMYPEKSKGCKIPSKMPLPSVPIQIKGSETVKQIASVPLYAYYVNPFCLVSQNLNGQLIKGNPPDSGDGIRVNEFTITSLTSSFFKPRTGLTSGDINHYYDGLNDIKAIPDMFCKYRLVSGSIKIKCISPLVDVNGRMGGGLFLKQLRYLGGTYDYKRDTSVTASETFISPSGFDKLMPMDEVLNMNLLNKVETNMMDGIEMKYIPIDNSFLEFYKVIRDPSDIIPEYIDIRDNPRNPYYLIGLNVNPKCMPSGFNWFFYFYKRENIALTYTIEYCFNYECLPRIEYVNILPVNITPKLIDKRLMHEVFMEVRKRCVMSLKEESFVDNMDDMQKDISNIKNIHDTSQYEYLNSLLYPEKSKGSKIPSDIPIPSATYQSKFIYKVRVNTFGEAMLFINPYFLCQKNLNYASIPCYINGEYMFTRYAAEPFNTIFVMDDGVRLERAAYFNWDAVTSTNVEIPNVYCKYRLVSASMNVRYLGVPNYTGGYIGGGILLKQLNCFGYGTHRSKDATAAATNLFSGFNQMPNMMDVIHTQYYREHSTLDGMRLLYFPPDKSYNEFIDFLGEGDLIGELLSTTSERTAVSAKNIEKYKCGFWWFLIMKGIGDSVNRNVELDVTCNFECIPNAEMMSFIPVSINYYNVDPELLKKIIDEVQNKCILKINN